MRMFITDESIMTLILENVNCRSIKGWSEVVYCIINMSFESFTNYVVICAILIDLKSAGGVQYNTSNRQASALKVSIMLIGEQ